MVNFVHRELIENLLNEENGFTEVELMSSRTELGYALMGLGEAKEAEGCLIKAVEADKGQRVKVWPNQLVMIKYHR